MVTKMIEIFKGPRTGRAMHITTNTHGHRHVHAYGLTARLSQDPESGRWRWTLSTPWGTRETGLERGQVSDAAEFAVEEMSRQARREAVRKVAPDAYRHFGWNGPNWQACAPAEDAVEAVEAARLQALAAAS